MLNEQAELTLQILGSLTEFYGDTIKVLCKTYTEILSIHLLIWRITS